MATGIQYVKSQYSGSIWCNRLVNFFFGYRMVPMAMTTVEFELRYSVTTKNLCTLLQSKEQVLVYGQVRIFNQAFERINYAIS